MIPLIIKPHEKMVLDANANLISTRFEIQKSCEGLYPRYAFMEKPSAWFTAIRSDGVVVGLSSVRIFDGKIARVDAFTVARYQKCWLKPLYQRASQWAYDQGIKNVDNQDMSLEKL